MRSLPTTRAAVRFLVFVLILPLGILYLVPESDVQKPLLFILLGVPLVLKLVPRNWFYGMRTCYALSSEERWYRQNVITGVVMIVGGVVWLAVRLTR